MSQASKLRKKTLRLALPATSANLGPAFDAAAIAMDFYIQIEATAAGEFSIEASGRDEQICGKLENHLILNTYRDVLQAAGRPITPLALKIKNDIPIGKGCGSSAAARLAGIAMAIHFGGLRWTDAQIIGEASRLEHHPDNAAACWMGGLAVAKMEAANEKGEALVASIPPKGKWPLLLAVPDQSLSTEAARGVLPTEYSRTDVVTNVQNSMLLLAAFTEGRPDLLAAALEDRIHQPYRAALCPLLPSLQKLKGKKEILGAVLSGAGPSVLIYVHPRASMKRAIELVSACLSGDGLEAEVLPTSIAPRGARF